MGAYLKQLTCLELWLSDMNMRVFTSVQARPLTQRSRAKTLTSSWKKMLSVKHRSSGSRNPCEILPIYFQFFIVSFSDIFEIIYSLDILSCFFAATCGCAASLLSWRGKAMSMLLHLQAISNYLSELGGTEDVFYPENKHGVNHTWLRSLVLVCCFWRVARKWFFWKKIC